MLSVRENFLETIKVGHPDRFVNQYEYLAILLGVDPLVRNSPYPGPGEKAVSGWGVTMDFEEGTPGPFPMCDPEHVVIKDITKWKDYVKAPNIKFPDPDWAKAKEVYEGTKHSDAFATYFVAPGIFEMSHYLMGIDEALANLYEEPEAMHGVIDYITNYELELAEEITSHVQPEALFHHDDWGSSQSTFMSIPMFNEFILPAYKKVYGYWKSHGVKYIIHHNDSWSATLVPQMIEMGIDVWQGPVKTNNLPELIKKYGGKITFMGGLNNNILDTPDWSKEKILKEVREVCQACGTKYFIPCLCQGLAMATFPGVYEATTDAINQVSKEMFK
jgi:hypothetical protein